MLDAMTNSSDTASASTAPYRVLAVCTGNICRSPLVEYLLRDACDDAGLAPRVEIASAGTTGYEVGNPIDPRAGAILENRDTDPSAHRAQAITAQMLRESDLILALDDDHIAPLYRLAGSDTDKIRMIRSFDPEAGDDLGIRDPWYGSESDFDTAAEQIDAAIPGIVAFVRDELDRRG